MDREQSVVEEFGTPIPRRRTSGATSIPRRCLRICRVHIQVIFNDLPQAQCNWWLVVKPHAQVDLCSVDPGFDVDLYLSTDLRTMTEIVWVTTTARAKEARKLTITGNRKLEAALGSWLS